MQMKDQDRAAAGRLIDTTSNRTKGMSASQSHFGEEPEEESYASGSEHDVYGVEQEDESGEEQENRDFDLTAQL